MYVWGVGGWGVGWGGVIGSGDNICDCGGGGIGAGSGFEPAMV